MMKVVINTLSIHFPLNVATDKLAQFNFFITGRPMNILWSNGWFHELRLIFKAGKVDWKTTARQKMSKLYIVK